MLVKSKQIVLKFLVPISAKYKKNVSKVLWHIREIVLKEREKEEAELDSLMKLQNNTIGRYIWETPEFIRGVRNITVPENACSK